MTALEVSAETAAESFADGILQYQLIGDVELESGASIPAVVLAYVKLGQTQR
ncbi:homoserine O-acetyltransferase [Renibacterium salmoninarum ATCC 33209]|uniref:Homoserine O-acetyltransferase n=1 Tax=Renibacterium salmoninarum (strain ATCC 33209 / DSM 20767 / JCM 11484 / NBRC 15589 / NCIMB 2235) TaxID=288705 RepID=A9WMJ1_RENSM|nr:homoserine O-acetyltransferase [Renibacterium salmoninarum ATCC 33209]